MIVNTRPGDLSQNTNSLLEKSKQNFIHIPLTKIVKTKPPSEAFKHIDNIKFYQEALLANKNMPILAIGLATQKTLQKFHLSSSIPPIFNSVGIANVIKEMGYKKCLVFCGEINPRIITMTDADIDTFPCYASNDETNIDVSQIRDKDKLVILIYTHQSLKVLMKELSVNQKQKVVLIVASQRIEGFAKEYGFKNSVLSESPHDKEMIEAALAEA